MAIDNVIYAIDLTNRRFGWSRGPDTDSVFRQTGAMNDWPAGGPDTGRNMTWHWLSSAGAVLANTNVALSTLRHLKTRTTETTGTFVTTDTVKLADLCTARAAATSGGTRTAWTALATVVNTNATVPRVTV